MPVDRFLSPDESCMDLVGLYVDALVSGAVTSQRTPLMYLIAVHHVNRLIYLQTDSQHQQMRYGIITRIMRIQDEVRETISMFTIHTTHARL